MQQLIREIILLTIQNDLNKIMIINTVKDFKETYNVNVSEKDFINISRGYTKFLIDKLFEGKHVALPFNLGTLQIIGKKQKIVFKEEGLATGAAVDWKATRKLWEENPETHRNKKYIYHLNTHSDGIRYKIHWTKYDCKVAFKRIYRLRMTSNIKRRLAKVIFNNNINFRIKI